MSLSGKACLKPSCPWRSLIFISKQNLDENLHHYVSVLSMEITEKKIILDRNTLFTLYFPYIFFAKNISDRSFFYKKKTDRSYSPNKLNTRYLNILGKAL